MKNALIKFYDPSGESHFGQATITRTTSVNGGLSLTGEVFAGDDVLNGLDYGWWLNFDNEKYVITYKKLSDDTNTIVFDAVQQFFWDFAKVALHSQYSGSHGYTFYLNQLFNGSEYTYKNDATVPAFEKESWGYKNKLSLFNDIMDQAAVEFEVHNETVHIAKQIGSDLTSFVRKGINLSDLTEEMKISDFATYAKGYGAFKDQQDPSKGRLEVEYRSELANKFGDLEMDPIVDERYTIASNLIAELKKKIDATYTVSMTMNIYDLENAGYPNYESPKVGDWILAIDEALNFKRKIRIIKLEEQFDVTGKRIGYTATCGDLSIIDQYTNIQSSLDSRVQRIQESVDNVAVSANGKSKNYYGTKEPVSADDGDLWFDQSNSDPDKWSIKQWANGRWEQLTLNPGEVNAKVEVAREEAETAVNNAKSTADKADQLASKYDDTNSLANQALDKAGSAQNDASSAVSKAESAASAFGKVDQKADSAFSNAMSAESAASSAVNQASSATADSKDAKQIAGAVSQSYKTLTDGSTMTIAELESGLAVKLTKSDLNGYATQDWSQNQIKITADGINSTLSKKIEKTDLNGYATQDWSNNQIKITADGINGTISSVKNTVGSHTTSINDLKADSNGFKDQFTKVNNTVGQHTTDIGTLQADSKSLSSNFDSLNTANGTNEHDISELKQTSKEVSSTLETVQTQVQNSAVGTNLFSQSTATGGYVTGGTGAISPPSSTQNEIVSDYISVSASSNYTFQMWGTTPNGAYYWYGIGLYDSDKKFISRMSNNGNAQTSDTEEYVSKTLTTTSTTAYVRVSFRKYNNYKVKLEKGSVATDWCPNPADNATVTAVSKISQTVDGMQTDISKKIEQKDLNGYATETWTQNQINVTADGINSTMSSVKSTVDGHTTSINDIQADSKEFKAQFTTYKDTVDRHDKDIGTLQADSKSLSSNFDSLNIDNGTNQHNIGELQQTAKKFSSTLETVQTQVQNSAVGTNLFSQSTATGGYVTGGTGAISPPSSTQNEIVSDYISVSASSNYTFQMWGTTPNGAYYWYGIGLYDSDKKFISRMSNNGNAQTSDTEEYVSKTLTTTSTTAYVRVSFRKYNNYKVKLEKGSVATDWCPNPADNATVTAVSSISQTIDKIQGTIINKADKSQITQLADQITSVVGSADSKVLKPWFDDGKSGTWNSTSTEIVAGPDSNVQKLTGHSNYLKLFNRDNYEGGVGLFPVTPGEVYYFSGYMGSWGTTYPVAVGLSFITESGNVSWIPAVVFPANSRTPISAITGSIAVPAGVFKAQTWVQIDGPAGTDLGFAAISGLRISKSASGSQIAQLKDDISLRVEKNGVINAVNISSEGTSIYGDKLHITATTYIDDAIIKSAMIESLQADKIRTGILDADKVQVVHLNAGNITAGVINGPNLKIDLDNGNVEFQKGRIHSADNTIDININEKYISVADNNTRVLLSGGEIQMVEPTEFSTEQTPYLRISNTQSGGSFRGATFWARDYFVITNQFNDKGAISAGTVSLGNEQFAGISGGHAGEGWQATKIGGADRGVFISGGKQFGSGPVTYSPYILVGDNGDAGVGIRGSNITMDAARYYIRSHRTTSGSADMSWGYDGELLRVTSATKYKTDIVRSFETEMGNKLLEIPVAHWKDKAEVLAKTIDPNAKDPKTYFGMIADDLDDAGLNELVQYDDKGEVDGIQYDRVALSLIPLIRDYRKRIIELETKVKEMKEV